MSGFNERRMRMTVLGIWRKDAFRRISRKDSL